MDCHEHGEVSVGTCETCGREVCEICLEEAEIPEEFECPDCGEYGVALYDDEFGELSEDGELSYDL